MSSQQASTPRALVRQCSQSNQGLSAETASQRDNSPTDRRGRDSDAGRDIVDQSQNAMRGLECPRRRRPCRPASGQDVRRRRTGIEHDDGLTAFELPLDRSDYALAPEVSNLVRREVIADAAGIDVHGHEPIPNGVQVRPRPRRADQRGTTRIGASSPPTG